MSNSTANMVKIGHISYPLCGTIPFSRWETKMMNALRLENLHRIFDHENATNAFTYPANKAAENIAKAFAIMLTLCKDGDQYRVNQENIDSPAKLKVWLENKYNVCFDSELKAIRSKFHSHDVH
jgi:hypothetical protein